MFVQRSRGRDPTIMGEDVRDACGVWCAAQMTHQYEGQSPAAHVPSSESQVDMHRDEPNSYAPTPWRSEDTSPDVMKQNSWPRGLAEAVLEGLPYSVAVLNRGGTIVAVSAAWKRFARDNGAPALAESSVGLNYLAICRAASGLSSE